jgi:hypothetical protein
MTMPGCWVVRQSLAIVKKPAYSHLLLALLTTFTGSIFGQQDVLLVPRAIMPKGATQRQIERPQVRWLVEPTAQQFCRHVAVKDGYEELQEGCVFWVLAKKECTLVTTGHSSHALLGELFMRCLEGRSH